MEYSNDEEKILLRKTEDLVNRAEKTYTVLYSHFLNPAEQTLLSNEDEFYGILSFDGGYTDAERRVARIKTNEYAADDGLPVVLFEAEITAPDAEISHRDVLGSLMGLGIKREMIGDIMVQGRVSFFFCHSSVADFVEMNLMKISRYRIAIRRIKPEKIPQPKTERLTINVSSMRLDSLCGECFGLSRTKAAEIIEKGLVTVNWFICCSNSKEIKAGDKIAMRGKGKVCISGISGISKKGRYFVEVDRYL